MLRIVIISSPFKTTGLDWTCTYQIIVLMDLSFSLSENGRIYLNLFIKSTQTSIPRYSKKPASSKIATCSDLLRSLNG